jgi:hypothetical protein
MNNLKGEIMGRPRILKDHKCPEHGYFESYVPECPHGCTEGIKVVFLKAPGLKSDKTKKNDQTLKNLASDFQMSNIKSTREGENQAGYYTRNLQAPKEVQQAMKEARPGDAAIWGGGMKGLNMQSILTGGAARPVRDESVGFNPKDVGNLTGPKAASYIPDHEGLKIKP